MKSENSPNTELNGQSFNAMKKFYYLGDTIGVRVQLIEF